MRLSNGLPTAARDRRSSRMQTNNTFTRAAKTALPKLRAESIMALMKRQLPPSRWLIDDPGNDEELVEAMTGLRPELQVQMTTLYQLLRHAGLPGRMDSIQDVLEADNADFW